MASTFTTNKNIEKPAYNSFVDDWNTPVNADWDIIDRAFGGTHTVSLTSSNVTLTQDQCQNVHILLTGVLTANVTVNFPSGVSGFYIVDNVTTGAFTVTLASAGAGPLAVLARQDANTFIWSDGFDVYLADSSPLTAGTGLVISGTTIDLQTPVAVANGGTGSGTYTNGQLLIGNTAGGLNKATLTAGSNVVITNGDGTITIAAAGGGVGDVTLNGTQTLTNKRINPRVVSAASASTLTPSIATADQYAYTALASALTINAPTGTPVDGNKLIFRIRDNGTARALTWNATYTVVGVSLPTTTVVNKILYVGCIYNAADIQWDVIAVTIQA
jgi:hypothetical protein